MKKLLFILSLITSFLVISSCSNANKTNSTVNNSNVTSTNSLIDYKDIYVEIDSQTQKDIEQAWLKKYNKEINWCMPIEMNEFKTIDDLDKYISSHYGIRIYGVFDGAYVLCKYEQFTVFSIFYGLMYSNVDEALVYNDKIWEIDYYSTYIYKDGNITALEENVYNIDDYLPITYEEALTIKEKNDKYIEKYFKKFMTEEDKDIYYTLDRIRNSLTPTQPNTTQTTKPNTTMK